MDRSKLTHRAWSTDSTVIPSSVKAHVSVRIVPDQDLETIASTVRDFLKSRFARMQSPNRLSVSHVDIFILCSHRTHCVGDH